MLAAPDRDDPVHLHPIQPEQRGGVAGAERLERADQIELFHRDLGGGELEIEREGGKRHAREMCRRIGVDPAAERVDVLLPKPHPGGELVPAVGRQQVGAGGDRVEQREPRNAAAGTLRVPVVHRQQDTRLAKPLEHPRREDPDHAAVPPVAREHQHPVGHQLRVRLDIGEDLFEDLPLQLLPLDVQRVDLLREPGRLLLVCGEQQLGRPLGVAHPARRVDARRQREHRGGGGLRLAAGARRLEQLLQPDPAAGVDLPQPRAHQHAVFPPDRHDVRERAERHQVGVLLEHPVAVPLERAHELERHPDARIVLESAAAVLPVRVDHRGRGGQRVLGTVVVCHHHVDPVLGGIFDLIHRRDPVVHRDEQPHPVRCQPVDRAAVQPISLVLALGDQVAHVGAPVPQVGVQQHRGGDPVRVVVAVDRHRLVFVQRLLDPVYPLGHTGKGKRVVGQLVPVQELLDLVRVGESAVGQQKREKRVEPAFLRQLRGQRLVERRKFPLFDTHTRLFIPATINITLYFTIIPPKVQQKIAAGPFETPSVPKGPADFSR